MAVADAVPTAEIDDLLGVLTTPDHDLQEIVDLVVDVCGANASGITVRRGGEYHVPVTHGIEPFVCAADDTFCTHTMSTDGVFHVEDARVDERFREISWVDGRHARARFYASAPIYDSDHRMVGRLCVIDSQPRRLSELQLRTLETLALSLTQLIELRLLRAGHVEPGNPAVRHAAETMMSRLSAELSHDLRVPLSSIMASTELLVEELAGHPDRTVSALLGRTASSAQRMLRMLDVGLQFGSTLDGPGVSEVDLGRVARQLVADSSALLDDAGAVVEIGPLPVVHADADEMYSVLQNLLTNAVKFTRPGVPPVVELRSRRTTDGWRVSMLDNGVGIPADRRADVFALFSRVDPTVEGHGIGLATVARIVTALFGRVGVDSAPGGGAEVWFELPAVERQV